MLFKFISLSIFFFFFFSPALTTLPAPRHRGHSAATCRQTLTQSVKGISVAAGPLYDYKYPTVHSCGTASPRGLSRRCTAPRVGTESRPGFPNSLNTRHGYTFLFIKTTIQQEKKDGVCVQGGRKECMESREWSRVEGNEVTGGEHKFNTKRCCCHEHNQRAEHMVSYSLVWKITPVLKNQLFCLWFPPLVCVKAG